MEDLRSRLNFSTELTIEQIQIFLNLVNMSAFIVLSENHGKKTEELDIQDENVRQLANLFTKESAEEYLRNNNVIFFVRNKI